MRDGNFRGLARYSGGDEVARCCIQKSDEDSARSSYAIPIALSDGVIESQYYAGRQSSQRIAALRGQPDA